MTPDTIARIIVASCLTIIITFLLCFFIKKYGESLDKWRDNNEE